VPRAISLLHRDLKRSPQQSHGLIHVFRLPDAEANPSALGQDVMRFGQPRLDDFVPHFSWEWNIDQGITVNVTDLAISQAIFGPTEPVCMGTDSFPLRDLDVDLCTRPVDGHGTFLLATQ
jgi:hypothetical protein